MGKDMNKRKYNFNVLNSSINLFPFTGVFHLMMGIYYLFPVVMQLGYKAFHPIQCLCCVNRHTTANYGRPDCIRSTSEPLCCALTTTIYVVHHYVVCC